MIDDDLIVLPPMPLLGPARYLHHLLEHPEEAPRELIWWGPAGCGKTHALCFWFYAICQRWPVKLLFVRETRRALTNSVMPLWEKIIGPDHPALLSGGKRSHRQEYNMGNGAEVVLGSLDDPERLRSTEYDLAWHNELQNYNDEEGFQELHRGLRRGKGPFHMLVADMNATHPAHFSRRRMKEGTAHELIGNVRHNPVYFDGLNKCWRKAGVTYLEGLAVNMPSGVSRARLLENQWAGAEGMVLEDWDESVHVITARTERDENKRTWVVIPRPRGDIRRELVRFVGAQDIGFTNPGVAQVWACDYDDRWYMVAEVFRTQLNHARWSKVWGKLWEEFPELERIVCDHDQAFIDALNSHLARIAEDARGDSIEPMARMWGKHRGETGEKAGIDEVRRRLALRDDGTRGLYVLAGCLRFGRDDALYRKGTPWYTAMEIPGVVYDERRPGKADWETPKKVNDHGFDAMRGMFTYVMKSRPEDRPARPIFPPGSLNARIPGLAETWERLGLGGQEDEDERDAG